MAIKYEDDKGERAKKPVPPPEKPAEDVQADPPGGQAEGQLPFAKPDPKPQGRK